MKCKTLFTGFMTLLCLSLSAQQVVEKADSSLAQLSKLSTKYVQAISSKTDKYYHAVTAKTEKTLERLAKWEAKIKTILEKASPETAQRLFANDQLTFASLLEKYKQGKVAADNYRGPYNEYRDKLTTTINYLEHKKDQLNQTVLKPLQEAKDKTAKLNERMKQTDALQQFIKERKKQLMEHALQYLGKSKYLQKITKENWYYVETIKNLKQTLSDPRKTEELAMKLLEKVPGFTGFLQRNSMLASLFRTPDAGGGAASLAGLQTRAQVNSLIQNQLAAGGPNARETFQQNLSAAQSQLSELKNKIIKAGGSSSEDESPQGFRPNNLRTKSFLQRIEIGTTLQSQKGNSYWPNSTDIGLSLGYKLNDRSVIGVGGAFKLGLGRGINAIKFTSEGAGIRSFIDWKIKGSFWISGGYEQNYRPRLTEQLAAYPLTGNLSEMQQSGLIGFSKKISLKTKFLKQTSVRLYWDFLSYQQVPKTQAIVFRLGYCF
ncbi:MAG: hypothetical protein NTW29_12080 [Bacteroidetes bacterium]|nr:hypothetical protein [Bacteroidota bacterium]